MMMIMMAKLGDTEHSCVVLDVGERWTEMCSDIVSEDETGCSYACE
jgi:hypothetical protein